MKTYKVKIVMTIFVELDAEDEVDALMRVESVEELYSALDCNEFCIEKSIAGVKPVEVEPWEGSGTTAPS